MAQVLWFAKLNVLFSIIDTRATDGVHSVLAANLRRLRIARHLSLSELARATGASKATLSGIENARANPTVDTLTALAGALHVSLAELLEEPPLGELRIVRAAHIPAERIDDFHHRVLDAISCAGDMELSELTLDAQRVFEATQGESGSRAHIYVLQGKLVAGPVGRGSELATGDYASFPADVPYACQAGRHVARALLLTQTAS